MRVCIGRCLDWPASEPTHTRSTEQPESWLAAQLCKAAGVCEAAEGHVVQRKQQTTPQPLAGVRSPNTCKCKFGHRSNVSTTAEIDCKLQCLI